MPTLYRGEDQEELRGGSSRGPPPPSRGFIRGVEAREPRLRWAGLTVVRGRPPPAPSHFSPRDRPSLLVVVRWMLDVSIVVSLLCLLLVVCGLSLTLLDLRRLFHHVFFFLVSPPCSSISRSKNSNQQHRCSFHVRGPRSFADSSSNASTRRLSPHFQGTHSVGSGQQQ